MMKPLSTIFFLLFLAYFFVAVMGCQQAQVVTPPTQKPDVVDASDWKSALKIQVKENLNSFEKAKDIEKFCPKFKTLTESQKVDAVSEMFLAIAKFESGYKPGTVYKESNGVDSIGLFQLSYGDRYCPKSKSEGDLKDPVVNVKCAVKIAAHFVSKDSVIAEGGYVVYGAPPAKGMARYWSVLRVPDSKSKHHLSEIKKRVSSLSLCQ